MRIYEVPIIIEGEREERIARLAERYRKINGWKEQDILEFAVNAYSSYLDVMLKLMEANADQFEKEEAKKML